METPEDRQTMALVLAQSSKPEFRMLAQELANPMLTKVSFAKLAENSGLNIHVLSEEIKAIHTSRGIMRAAPLLEELVVQTAEEALAREEACDACAGEGMVLDLKATTRARKEADERGDDTPENVTRLCPKCKGERVVHVKGDAERLKIMFETFGLTGVKGAGVNVNLDLRKTDAPERMADLAASLGPILEGNTK